jgi:membrane-associated phospholipid phosphatase
MGIVNDLFAESGEVLSPVYFILSMYLWLPMTYFVENAFMDFTRTALILILCFLISDIAGQSPYQLKTGKEIIFGGTGLATLGAAFLLQRQVEPLPLHHISLIARNDVNAIDRLAIDYYSESAQLGSDVLMLGSYLVPITFLAGRQMRKDIIKLGMLGAETFALASGLTLVSKNLTLRTRPFVYNQDVPLSYKLKKNARYSFFSGHVSTTAAMTFFSAKVYSDYYPDSKWKPAVWTFAATVPAVTGYLRVKGGKHFPTDVVSGYLVGSLIGYFVPVMHHAGFSKDLTIELLPGSFLLHLQF